MTRDTTGQDHDVHPTGWTNPIPPRAYRLLVLGGGCAAVRAAIEAARLTGPVALVAARIDAEHGLDDATAARLDFWQFVQSAAADLAQPPVGAASAALAVRFAEWTAQQRRSDRRAVQARRAQQLGDLGIEIHFGSAVFTGPDTIAVHGRELKFERAIVAPGPAVPSDPIPAAVGADAGPLLTVDDWNRLESLPKRLAVLGGGPGALELADAFARLGSEVHLISAPGEFMSGEEPGAVDCLARGLQRQGVRIHRDCALRDVEQLANARLVTIEHRHELRKLLADELLVLGQQRQWTAPGGLAAARLTLRDAGLVVDDRLRTSNARIYAAGVCCATPRPLADAEAYGRLAVRNALLSGGEHYSAVVAPRIVRASPQLVQVGCTTLEARELGMELDTYRCALPGHFEHFALIHTRHGTGRLLGATLVAPDAAALAPLLTLLVKEQLSLETLAELTTGHLAGFEALRSIAQQYARRGSLAADRPSASTELAARV
ncbi:MAG: FAD-dependent oxidoreductase [Pirellulales bacterium]|nr:FAD-dependent oxidoreductase [Pirellulales bacterium]